MRLHTELHILFRDATYYSHFTYPVWGDDEEIVRLLCWNPYFKHG